MNRSVVNCYRTTPEEREVISKAATAAGKNLSDYARDILLAAADYPVTDTDSIVKKELQNQTAKKDISYTLRISKAEERFYNSQAKEAGCTVSEYIRRSANGNKVIIVPGMKEVARQIAKLGVNINQLTTLAHQGRIKEVDLFACNDTLKQILKKLLEIKKG